MRECSILLHNIVLQVNVTDKWSWLLDPSNGYLVWEAYRFITNSGEHVDRSLIVDVWHRHIPTKVSLFVWRLLRDRLPTQANLFRRNIISTTDSLCAAGYETQENSRHLFLEYETASTLWFKICNWLGISSVIPGEIHDHYIQFSCMAGLPRSTHSYLKGTWFACVWIIWKERINRIFKNEALHSYIIFEKVKLNSFLWVKAKQPTFSYCYYDWWTNLLLCMGVHR